MDVFNSKVTAPAAAAAGKLVDCGCGVVGTPNPPPAAGVELNVFTVLISVLIG